MNVVIKTINVFMMCTILSGTGSSTTTNISVEEFVFASANDYAIEAMVVASSSNYWATKICIESKTAKSFTLRVFNDHWSGGAIGSSLKVQWVVHRLRN